EKTKLVFEGVVITNDKMRFSCIPAIGKR
ncbi:MAG: hypothetical protein JWO06_597, partial [Bacteroidota bacterium]|nr:hypothetical protein [Bacteroidota bacterium]